MKNQNVTSFIIGVIVFISFIALLGVIIMIVASVLDDVNYSDRIYLQSDSILQNFNVPVTLSETVHKQTNTVTNNNTWLNFDGENDYLRIPPNSNFEFDWGSNWTVLYWDRYNNNSQIPNWPKVWSIGNELGNKDNGFSLVITKSNGQFGYEFYNGSTTKNSICTQCNLDDEEWHYIVHSYESSDINFLLEWYIDGISIRSNNETKNSGSIQKAGNLTISAYPQLNNFYNNSLEEFILYDKVLSEFQITALYNSSSRGKNLGKIVPMIYYHKINDTPTDNDRGITTNTSDFENMMIYINQSNLTTITSQDLINAVDGISSLPEKPIIIQFDDAWYDTLTTAKPIMDTYGLIGEIPIITERPTNNGNPRYMTWENLTTIKDAGWGIVSHSVNHSNMSALSQSDRQQQLIDSRNAIIGNLSIIPNAFVHPGNQYIGALDDCAIYYRMCSTAVLTDSNPEYIFKDGNLTHYAPRIGHWNETVLKDFRQAVNIYGGKVIELNLNENTGTTTYDTSENSNNGTINGATWETDGINKTLINNIDYSVSGNLFTILNSEFAFSNITFEYQSLTQSAEQIRNDSSTISHNTGVFFSSFLVTVGPAFGLLILFLIIAILVTLIVFLIKSVNGIESNKNFS